LIDNCPPEIQRQIGIASFSASLRLLAEQVRAEEAGYRFILDPHVGTDIVVGVDSQVTPSVVSAMQDLVAWVTAEPTKTRLRVARRLVAEEIHQIKADPSIQRIRTRAELAYAAAIDEQTGKALAAVASFEDHVNNIAARINDLGRALDKTVDETVTRTLAALLAILVAAVVSKDVQGWPLFVASAAVAAYVIWTAIWILGGVRADVVIQGALMQEVFSDRPKKPAEAGREVANRFVQSVSHRVMVRQSILVGLAVAILIVGVLLAQYAGGSQDNEGEQRPNLEQTPSPTT